MASGDDGYAQLVYGITSIKYYRMALMAILFYDYFLTLGDEVRYAWKGKKSWVFTVFILNRYLPMIYAIWLAVANHSRAYTYGMCSKTAFFETLFFVWSTLCSQIILNARLYAITTKNATITGLLLCITVSQFLLGMCAVALIANSPGMIFRGPRTLK